MGIVKKEMTWQEHNFPISNDHTKSAGTRGRHRQGLGVATLLASPGAGVAVVRSRWRSTTRPGRSPWACTSALKAGPGPHGWGGKRPGWAIHLGDKLITITNLIHT